MCVTLNEGYLGATIKGSNILYRFWSKYNISAFSEKTKFLVCLFEMFLFETADLGSYWGYFQ